MAQFENSDLLSWSDSRVYSVWYMYQVLLIMYDLSNDNKPCNRCYWSCMIWVTTQTIWIWYVEAFLSYVWQNGQSNRQTNGQTNILAKPFWQVMNKICQLVSGISHCQFWQLQPEMTLLRKLSHQAIEQMVIFQQYRECEWYHVFRKCVWVVLESVKLAIGVQWHSWYYSHANEWQAIVLDRKWGSVLT